jgi:hypothetical protein
LHERIAVAQQEDIMIRCLTNNWMCVVMQMSQATGFGLGLFFCWQQMGQSILTIGFPADLLGLCYSH